MQCSRSLYNAERESEALWKKSFGVVIGAPTAGSTSRMTLKTCCACSMGVAQGAQMLFNTQPLAVGRLQHFLKIVRVNRYQAPYGGPIMALLLSYSMGDARV